MKTELHPRQEFIYFGPDGLPENAMAVVGYENPCMMISVA